jgi:hypothetical protein
LSKLGFDGKLAGHRDRREPNGGNGGGGTKCEGGGAISGH